MATAAKDAGSSFTFDVKSLGATAAVTADGSIAFRKEVAPNADAVVATIPAGLAWDSGTGKAGAAQTPVAMALTPTADQPAGTTRITVSVDKAWINERLTAGCRLHVQLEAGRWSQ